MDVVGDAGEGSVEGWGVEWSWGLEEGLDVRVHCWRLVSDEFMALVTEDHFVLQNCQPSHINIYPDWV